MSKLRGDGLGSKQTKMQDNVSLPGAALHASVERSVARF